MSNVSYKPAYRTQPNDPKFYTNNLAFATYAEAERSARDLASRWLLVIEWQVQPSDQPVNYTLNENGELIAKEH